MAETLSPEFVRNIDSKCRVTVPARLADLFPAAAKVTLREDGVIVIEPAARGRRMERVDRRCLTLRVIIPTEFRELAGTIPGARVAMTTEGDRLLVWAWGKE